MSDPRVGRMYTHLSAIQKMIRRGMTEEALYYVFLLEKDGFMTACLNRLVTTVHEDIGAGDKLASLFALKSLDCAREGYPKGGWILPLTNAIIAMCKAQKSRDADTLHICVKYEIATLPYKEPPDWVYDHHTLRGKQMKRGIDFFYEEAAKVDQNNGNPDWHEKAWIVDKECEETGLNIYNTVYGVRNTDMFTKPEDKEKKKGAVGLDDFS